MKKFLLVLMAVVAFSSVGYAYNPHGAPEAVGSTVDAKKESAGLVRETVSPAEMLPKADQKEGKGASWSGSKSSTTNTK